MVVHTLVLDGWAPTPLNVLMRAHWSRRRKLLFADEQAVGLEARARGISRAVGKRRVSVTVQTPRSRDADGTLKSLFDALVQCGLLVDDAPAWCEIGPVQATRGPRRTVVVLEDVDEDHAEGV